jgi:uncharacterized protein (TIGR03089 family)
MKTPTTPAQLLKVLRSERPTSPRLIWYGPDHERVELSGHVLDNWVAKTANYMVEELDAEAGSRVRLDLPPHWRTLVWALATWQTGGTLVVTSGAVGADITATSAPAAAPPAGGLIVAVALGALALRWTGDLPAGVLDYAAEVRAFGDYYDTLEDASGLDTALEFDGGMLSYADLLPEGTGASGTGAGDSDTGRTVLIPAALPLDRVLREALDIWAADGSVVLVHPDVNVTDSLISSERISARL